MHAPFDITLTCEAKAGMSKMFKFENEELVFELRNYFSIQFIKT
jgi:hypothetical protein